MIYDGKEKMEKGKAATSLRVTRVRDFTDLETWKVARTLRQEIYKVTQRFPPEEKYVLVAQMRRAAISVTANLAEGYGRFSYQENIQFCRQSRASAYELRDHLTTALDAGYISKEEHSGLNATAMSTIRLINGYIRSTRKLQQSPDKPGQDA